MKPYKMPPPEGRSGPLLGPKSESLSVGSWCPTPDGSGPAEAVAISVTAKLFGDGPPLDIVIRLKSPMEVDRVVQMLLRHKRDVWPEAR